MTSILHFEEDEMLIMIRVLESEKNKSESVSKLLGRFKDEYSFWAGLETKKRLEA